MEIMKKCFKCEELFELDMFYRHSGMRDGRLNKCINCTKKDVFEHRVKNIDKVRAYDRERGNRQGVEYLREYRARFPRKYRAHSLVRSALRSGAMQKQPCEICGAGGAHGHHDDYLKPRSVRWLCAAHHSQWHRDNGEGANP